MNSFGWRCWFCFFFAIICLAQAISGAHCIAWAHLQTHKNFQFFVFWTTCFRGWLNWSLKIFMKLILGDAYETKRLPGVTDVLRQFHSRHSKVRLHVVWLIQFEATAHMPRPMLRWWWWRVVAVLNTNGIYNTAKREWDRKKRNKLNQIEFYHVNDRCLQILLEKIVNL